MSGKVWLQRLVFKAELSEPCELYCATISLRLGDLGFTAGFIMSDQIFTCIRQRQLKSVYVDHSHGAVCIIVRSLAGIISTVTFNLLWSFLKVISHSGFKHSN